MPISFIDPEYRSNIIFAIYRYQMIKPHARIEDVAQCLAIAQAEYRSHRMLRRTLKNYLENIRTGFHLLGLQSLPVRTGRSILRTLIMQALDSKREEDLLAYELGEDRRIKSLDAGLSRDELVVENETLLRELESLDEKKRSLQENINRLVMEYKTLEADTKKLEKKLDEEIWRGDKLSIENREIHHNLIELTEEKNALLETNKRLRSAIEQRGLRSDSPTFFSQANNIVMTPL